MPIPESQVAAVVSEVSRRMSEPGYAQLAIGGFAQSHPDAGRYITAHLDELGGGEAVMHAVFHAEVLNECFRRHLERELPPVRFADLDAAAKAGDPIERLRASEPALADYVASNVDVDAMRRVLALVALAMSRAAR
ncbi:MAG: hypothetical protein M5U28_01975 [Sandaracinaceae bacterium]|nr:hypothetical protein [Sandaracinaceae bacterium]